MSSGSRMARRGLISRRLYHPGYRVLIGYLFPSAGSPWIADWQENRSNTTLPWNGEVAARGIEFGSSPFAEGLRKSIERGTLFDTPAYQWIGARLPGRAGLHDLLIRNPRVV